MTLIFDPGAANSNQFILMSKLMPTVNKFSQGDIDIDRHCIYKNRVDGQTTQQHNTSSVEKSTQEAAVVATSHNTQELVNAAVLKAVVKVKM